MGQRQSLFSTAQPSIMELQKWRQNAKKQFNYVSASLNLSFHLLTLTLLSLLLPLSFLLLSRLTCTQYFLALSPQTLSPNPISSISSVSHSANSNLLYLLLPLVALATLLQCLEGKSVIQSEIETKISRLRLCAAWIFLSIMQICVGLGVQVSLAVRIDGSGFYAERGLWSRVLFFLGLLETMMLWGRMVVRPVADDTVYGYGTEEKWWERGVMGMSYGGLWWWRLRDEVEALVSVSEIKRDLVMGIGLDDLVCWCLYYLIVMIGIVKVVKGVVWVCKVLFCKREISKSSESSGVVELV